MTINELFKLRIVGGRVVISDYEDLTPICDGESLADIVFFHPNICNIEIKNMVASVDMKKYRKYPDVIYSYSGKFIEIFI